MKDIIYELAYLISGQLDEIEAQGLAKKIEKTLGESGVIISSIEPKKMKLSYPIKKQQEGFLVSINFTADPKFILLLSKEIEKEANILRFLTIKKSLQKPEPIKERPSIIKSEIPKDGESVEEKKEVIAETPKKEKVKKEKVESLEEKKEGLKKIEKDLDEILGQ